MPRRYLLAAVLVIGLPALVQAQYLKSAQGRMPPAGAQPVEIHGTLQAFARGNIMVMDQANNQAWRIALLPATKVHVTGTASPSSLRSGLIVEIAAQVDNGGAIQKVSTLTVTSISFDKQMGIFTSDAGAAGDGTGAPAKRIPAKAGPQAAGTYRIVGKLVVQRGGALAIQPGRGLMPFELSDQPTIKIDSSDLTTVSRGTEVAVRGVMMPGRPGLAQAIEVTVKLPEPPAEPSAKRGAKQPSKTGDESGLPASAGGK